MSQFRQVDVFSPEPFRGNPVAVVFDADGLTTGQMQQIANWTNLSETTFLVPATDPAADYQVRIFTPVAELPFAGHPTLGTCHAFLEAGGEPKSGDEIVQQCEAGLIRIRRTGARLAFAAPPLRRSGPVEESVLEPVLAALGLSTSDVVLASWADNGPSWIAIMLSSAEHVLAVRPSYIDQDVGLVGFHPGGSASAYEVRAFFPKDGALVEDPVTGSFNAAVAQWLLGARRVDAPYVASQGTVLGRAGRIHIARDPDGTVWVGGDTVTRVSGTFHL